MVNLQLASFTPYSGKSAIGLALGLHYRAKGLLVRYIKPLSLMTVVGGRQESWDATFISEKLGAKEPPERISPVLVTPDNLEKLIEKPQTYWQEKVKDSYEALASGTDLILVESGMNWAQGYSIGLGVRQLSRLLSTKVLLVMTYEPNLYIDGAVFANDELGGALAGVIVNRVPQGLIGKVQAELHRIMKHFKVPVIGVLPEDRLLNSISVEDLAEVLGGEILQDYERGYPEPVETEEAEGKYPSEERQALIENFSVGAMNVEQALTYFRRIPRKAVITGGDRADIQLAALETDTVALILTGNLFPAPLVQTQAALQHVPIILVAESTMQVVNRVNEVLGPIRIRDERQINRLIQMVENEPGLAAFSKSLGLPV